MTKAVDTNKVPGREYARGVWIAAPAQQQRDTETGHAFDVLSGGIGNNVHVYFNRANFTYDGRHLIFRSDRTGSWQLYAYDISEQRLRRLTEATLDPHVKGRPCIDPCRPLLYYMQGSEVHRLNIETLVDEVVYRHPTSEGGTFYLMDISGDGQYLGFVEEAPFDKTDDARADWGRRFEARPLTSFWIATADGARVWKVHEEKRCLQHLLFCPTDPTTLMYCHEGPNDRVEQRMWLMHWDGTRIRPLRYQETPDLAIGHEYWCRDGRHVDYMNYARKAICRIDTLSGEETVLADHHFCHFISDRSGTLIVGDEFAGYITLLDVKTGTLTPLVRHNQEMTMANGLYHPHPAFSPDGKHIVFCRKDEQGRNDVCLMERPNNKK